MSDTAHRRTPVRWMFENRSTGRITIAQTPNIPLAVFLVCVVARLAVRPRGSAGHALAAIETVALVVWAGDEIVRGVNPFRRLLGAAVLVGQAIALFKLATG